MPPKKNATHVKPPEGSIMIHQKSEDMSFRVSQMEKNFKGMVKTLDLYNMERNFDGKYPITWIFQMDQFFDLHQVPNLQKVTITSLYLEPEQFVWYQWICE